MLMASSNLFYYFTRVQEGKRYFPFTYHKIAGASCKITYVLVNSIQQIKEWLSNFPCSREYARLRDSTR